VDDRVSSWQSFAGIKKKKWEGMRIDD
jgi:hypothetical protein